MLKKCIPVGDHYKLRTPVCALSWKIMMNCTWVIRPIQTVSCDFLGFLKL